MSSVSSVCAKCGAEVMAGAPAGVCTACLFETGLDLLAGAPVAGVADSGVRAADKEKAARPGQPHGDFGDYELLDEIGRGGQGVVYRARQKSLNRIVALKVIGLGHWATESHLKRFRLEAEAAASLNHPCIVPIYEIGERDGSCYFSMGLVEGGQLDRVVKQEPMPPRQTADLIAKLARTVQYAHEHGILHRDIKPGNILLDTKGEPHLTDFGLARLVETESTVTLTLEVLGTPSYMAPEQAKASNGQITNATDVYGLGAVLYHLLTGHPPFAAGTTYETVRLVLESEPRKLSSLNPKIDRDLSTICLKCLEKDPKRRYSSAIALAEDLEHWQRHEPIRARHVGAFTRGRKWVQRKPAIAALIASLIALAATMSALVWKAGLVGRQLSTTGIAVLPFENLSNDREDASFADGVQDDLLTKLANIAALRVISRTSVLDYRGKHNTREIGEALRVSHVLEGSVRKTGAWLHINAQLIDIRTDSHVWAKQYDGDLKDLFVIQSQIAQEVAEQLHARVSAAEKAAIKHPPTADLTAFDLYARGKNLLSGANVAGDAKTNLLQAAELLNQALAHDSSFFQAYCELAYAHDRLYVFGFDHTAARLALANAAIEAAFRLRPDAGESHLALAAHLYFGSLDYNRALAELAFAQKTLPNDPRIYALKGYIKRRQGRPEEALHNLERAIELDPRNIHTLRQIAMSYGFLRRYAEVKSILDRVLAIEPDDVEAKVDRALVDLDWEANTRPLHQLIDSLQGTNPAAISKIAGYWLICALAERDGVAAGNALIALGDTPYRSDAVQLSRLFLEGFIARMIGDDKKAHLAFTSARAEQERIVQAQPDYGPPLCVLGLIDAALGRKEQALLEGYRAVELLPVQKDGINGPLMIQYFAMIAAWLGDKDLACEKLSTAIRLPGDLSYGQLKLLPFWDPLRGDPRFEKIVNSLAPR